MAKKKSNEPKRQFRKHQPTRAQQRKRKQRILLITAISVIGAVAGIIGSGWYAERYQSTGADQETAAQLREGSDDFGEGTRILGETPAPDEETGVRILGDSEDPSPVTAPPALDEAGAITEQTESPIITSVSAREAFNLIQENQNNPDFVIIDVRKPEEFAGGHIAGAINRYKYSSSFETELDKLDRTKTYLVYCRKCLPPYPCSIDPPGAAAVMRDLGFGEVYNMGGVTQWEAEGYLLVQ